MGRNQKLRDDCISTSEFGQFSANFMCNFNCPFLIVRNRIPSIRMTENYAVIFIQFVCMLGSSMGRNQKLRRLY
jgi:hypothetical protein